MRIEVDKVASVTRSLKLNKRLTIQPEVAAEFGAVVVGRVLNDKSTYNTIEDVHGRMSTVQAGDLIVGALGHRNALHGYEGVLPDSVKAGDTLNLLNLGGVIGISVSHNPDVGAPFELEILGQVLVYPDFASRVGKPANIRMNALAPVTGAPKVPVVYVAGTCMNSGKTAAACMLVKALSRAGYRVGACKLTGVSLIRDILAMRDYGAEWVLDFTDCGIPTSTPESAPETARIVFSQLASHGAEVIVTETGDGIMGDYGVQAVLSDAELMDRCCAMVLCANDPVGVAGAVWELRKQYDMAPDVISGPATDNRVGVRFVEREFGIPAINARTKPLELGAMIVEAVRGKAAKA